MTNSTNENVVDSSQVFQPATVTKPIQLLSAWLIGLIAVNTSFLASASLVRIPDWAPGALVVSAILNVPLFLFCLFFLQTRFRPEMQEDSYYARYLERKSVETQSIEYVRVGEDTKARPDTARIEFKSSRLKRAPKDYKENIAVNDLLPNFRDVVKALDGSGIGIDKTFGSTNPELIDPDQFIITIGCDVDLSVMRRVVSALSDMKIDGFCLATDWHPEEIYIGAYNYKFGNSPIKPADPTIQKLLSKDLNRNHLIELLS